MSKSADLNTPPPYTETQTTNPILYTNRTTISPVAHQDAIITGATIACTLSSSAITARALAESPDAAGAMANALELIQKTITTIFAARGIPSSSPIAAEIWAAVLSSSARKARVIANRRDELDLASQEAARLERLLASGKADALAIDVCRSMGVTVAT